MLIVCGPPCSGKSTFGLFAASQGISVVEGSNAVKDIYARNSAESEDIIDFCRRWYVEHGADIFARENVSRIASQGINPDEILFVGCRTIEEVRYLKKVVNDAVVIGLHADTSTRFNRCLTRDRADRALSLSEFIRRDMREMEMGLAHILGHSVDRFLVNEKSLTEFEDLVKEEVGNHFK